MADDENGFLSTLVAAAAGMGISLTVEQQSLMWRHFQLVIETNQRFNLTRITSPVDAAVKHYADSLTLLASGWVHVHQTAKVLDVGTGAGFPAVPLAIICPTWQVTAIDGTGKKARFVEECAGQLGLKNLHAQHARAADLARGGASKFDWVLLRAVSQLAPAIEEVHSLVAKQGGVVFYKSATIAAEELAQGQAAADRKGLRRMDQLDIQLPSGGETIERRLIRYRRN